MCILVYNTKCHRYNSYKFCKHTIAISIYCNIFSDYIQQYKAKFSKLKGNLTAISLNEKAKGNISSKRQK